jgi:hypothetical protein
MIWKKDITCHINFSSRFTGPHRINLTQNRPAPNHQPYTVQNGPSLTTDAREYPSTAGTRLQVQASTITATGTRPRATAHTGIQLLDLGIKIHQPSTDGQRCHVESVRKDPDVNSRRQGPDKLTVVPRYDDIGLFNSLHGSLQGLKSLTNSTRFLFVGNRPEN